MLHRIDGSPFEARRQRAALEHLVGSDAALRDFGARYAGPAA